MKALSRSKNPNAVIRTGRVLPAEPRIVFAAFEQPDHLARWWGPAGFTNTFQQFEFGPGGRWVYVKHGPDGRDYPNESVFREIESDTRIVNEHVSLPIYTLTITLSHEGDNTLLTWEQEFENAAFVTRMRSFLENANNENLDRLEAALATGL